MSAHFYPSLTVCGGLTGVLQILPSLPSDSQAQILGALTKVLWEEGADAEQVERIGRQAALLGKAEISSASSSVMEDLRASRLLLRRFETEDSPRARDFASLVRAVSWPPPLLPLMPPSSFAEEDLGRLWGTLMMTRMMRKTRYCLREEDMAVHAPPVSPYLTRLERFVVDSMGIPDHAPLRFLLLGPGRSRTDPLYALRVMDLCRKRWGVSGRLFVVDHDDDPLIRRYYEKIPWNGHEARLFLGENGFFENVVGCEADLTLMIHPNGSFEDILDVVTGNTKRGGIVIIQKDLYAGENRRPLWRSVHYLRKIFEKDFDFLLPPYEEALFSSSFSDILEAAKFVFVLQRKAK